MPDTSKINTVAQMTMLGVQVTLVRGLFPENFSVARHETAGALSIAREKN